MIFGVIQIVFQHIGAGTGGTWGASFAGGGFGQDFYVGLVAAFAGDYVDLADQGRQVHHFGGFLGHAKAAVEVPVVGALGHHTAAFALDVLADLVFDGVQNAVAVLAFNGQGKSFSHGQW